MDCADVRATMLESFDEPLPAGRAAAVEAHLGGCADCARFAVLQRALDRRLSIELRPPELSGAFRSRLRAQIRRETRQLWSPVLPDVVHFLACGTATVMCALLLPVQATLTLGVGAAVTVVTHLLAAAVRDALERADEPTW